ncbi:MAG: formylmethanofuran dehydrogenase [Chloroflexi bacterium]|nr:formylmethanofuran dehydrogenase [Chloroflexota bacterium]MBV9133084.1 formylmethanofuran dehydrogenase [Chloroflexota bacterium]MBV9895251.1 formylmethanofuran dehydrogenase [Chloroflexota bacterium]
MRCTEQLEALRGLHARLCPRQVLGVRIGLQAAELLEVEAPRSDKRLLTIVETDGCFADGVSVATGCWAGRRTLRVEDYGKVAACCVDTLTGAAVRIWPHPLVRVRAREAQPAARDNWHAQLEAYQWLPSEQLLSWEPVQLRTSLAELLGRPGGRETCATCGEEILNGRGVGVGAAVVCRPCATGGAYYSATRATTMPHFC